MTASAAGEVRRFRRRNGHADGWYVSASDYDALKAALTDANACFQKAFSYGGECNTKIASLTQKLAEAERQRDEWIGKHDAELFAHAGAKFREEKLTSRFREMEGALRKFTHHHVCEDCWYSCATLTCDDCRKSDVCDCGAQIAIDVLSLTSQSREGGGT